MLWFPRNLYYSARSARVGSMARRNDHPQVFDAPNTDYERPPKNIKPLRPLNIKTSQHSMIRPSSSRSDTKYIKHHVENDGEYEFDLEAQVYMPSGKGTTFSVDVPGDPTPDEGQQKKTDPLQSDLPFPTLPATHRLLTSSPPSAQPPEHQLTRDDALRRSIFPWLEMSSVQTQCPTYLQSGPTTFHHPRPVRLIHFDVMSIFANMEKPVLPELSDKRPQYVSPTYSDFLRLQDEIEERITSKSNYRSSSESPDWSPTQTQDSSNGVTPSMYGQRHRVIVTEGNPDGPILFHHGGIVFDQGARCDRPGSKPSSNSLAYRIEFLDKAARSNSQPPKAFQTPRSPVPQQKEHSAHLSNLPPTELPTSFDALHCLQLVNGVFRHTDLGSHLDDVRDALGLVQNCLREQGEIPRDIWKERYDSWNTLYHRRIESLTSCVRLISGMLREEDIDAAHEIHLIAEEVCDIALNLRASFYRLRQYYLRKQEMIWATGAKQVLSSFYSRQ